MLREDVLRQGQVTATSRVTEPESGLPEEVNLGWEAEKQPYPAQGGSRGSQTLRLDKIL